jgi:hypothetical protein
MQRMWRQMFAAVAGVVVIAGAAAAQSPPPQPLPPIIPVAAPVHGSGYAVPAVMPATIGLNGGAIQNAIPPTVNQPIIAIGHGSRGKGCADPCATPCPTPCAAPANPCATPANGCSSFKQDCNFMFGSSKSFFDACGPTGGHGGCGGHGLGRFGKHGANCPVPPWGTPYNQGGWTHCHYDSFLNH